MGMQGSVWPFLEVDEAVPLVREYFGVDEASGVSPTFSGAWFERLGGGGDANGIADVFTATDIVAVEMLSVSVPSRAGISLLETDSEGFNELLLRIGVWDGTPDGVALHTHAGRGALASGGAAWQLWKRLRELHGVGPVTAGKLMARKRPHLVPIFDRVVKAALIPDAGGFWEGMVGVFEDEEVVGRLGEIRDRAEIGWTVSLPRILDVAIWMRNQGILTVDASSRMIKPILAN